MTDVLILVGTNPLPCYVSALYLKDLFNGECRIHLVCSKDYPKIKQVGTYRIAERIKDVLVDKEVFASNDIYLKEIDDVSRKQSIEMKLKEIKKTSESIHLNYTGGTKAMAALSFRFLADHEDFSSSYLDSRRNRIILDQTTVDEEVDEEADTDIGDLRAAPKYQLDYGLIMRLHGIKLEEQNTKNQFPEIMRKMQDILMAGNQQDLTDLYGRNKRMRYYPLCVRHEEETRIFENAERLFIGLYGEEKFGSFSDEELKQLHEYIDGIWLEHLIFENISRYIDPDDGIHIHFDVSEKNVMQIDLVAVYGYQLTVISVTTDSTKGLVKQKAFEAIHRARQLGGDEAKTILISLMEAPKTVEEDVSISSGSLAEYFRAFGANEIKDNSIYSKIIEYIKE